MSKENWNIKEWTAVGNQSEGLCFAYFYLFKWVKQNKAKKTR